MITITLQDCALMIRPITSDEINAVLNVYRQCEDFLALGPVATASTEMVLKDIALSRDYGGQFCGIYTAEGEMIGIIDYVPSNFEGDPRAAYLSLLMIATPFRGHGIGQAVVEAIENEIKRNIQIDKILSGVQINNLQAMQFWQRIGYRIISEPKLYPDQTTAVELCKDLNPRTGNPEMKESLPLE